ncbi:MAG TPA: Xaa-Pro dipeptidase [Thermoanaerobaculia bacterium]|nr:Xaa-Pro dipeptidase [Thermoanaerobaculia bacterium]
MADLYAQHLVRLAASTARALEETGFDRMVVHSGVPFTYFADDNDAPFRSTPTFAHWAPVEGPYHLLDVVPGKRPRLVRVQPRDYWYAPPAPAPAFVTREFDVVDVATSEAAWKALGNGFARTAFVGGAVDESAAHGFRPENANPKGLVARLDWERSYKSDWEAEQVAVANAKAARGYRALEKAFRADASEMELHHAYLTAIGDVEEALPYTSIVALDDRSATLHYHGKRGRLPSSSKVLLVDAGATVNGYASDITRTWVKEGVEPVFARLLDGMKALQAKLCLEGRPGLHYRDFHLRAQRYVGELLREVGVLKISAEEAVTTRLTFPFFPHGLGHFLGLQVHDVAGRQADRTGTPAPPPADHPALRTVRPIEERMLFTVEPGLYFIPMLLEPVREGPHRAAIDWPLVDRLIPMGGIRVEDNIFVGKDANRNLTRESLPE